MKRKFLSVLFALVLVLSFSLVTAAPAGAIDGAVPHRFEAVTLAADRLVVLQSTTDHGWDYPVTGLSTHSEDPSAYNLYGVTALGLIDAYEVTGESSYLTAAGLLADNMTGGDASEGGFFHGADVHTGGVKWYVAQDYQFLMRYAEVSDSTYSAYAIAAWDWQKANLHEGRYVSGQAWYDWAIVEGYDVGTVVWQGAAYGLAALAMGDTDWAGSMADRVSLHFGEITGDDPMAWANALRLLNAVGPDTYSDSIATLIAKLIARQSDTSGSWDTGWAELQDTAYAVMALAVVGEAETAQKGAAWLVASQLANGEWLEDDDEYSETDSESLQALAATAAPVTIVEDGYYSIQDAIDSASPNDTISVAAGTTYAPFTVDTKTGLTIQSSSVVTVQGVQSVTTAYTDRDCVVFVKDSTDIVLDDLDIQGQNLGTINAKNYGVIYENSSGEIKDCTVSPNTIGDMLSIAIGIWDGSEVIVDPCTIENFGRVGMLIYNACTVEVLDSTIKGQVYSGEGEVCYGIEVEGVSGSDDPATASQVTIRGNEIYNCDNTFATGPTWQSGGVYINGWLEHNVEADSTVIVENNDIHSNYSGIIVIKSSLSYANYNNIYDNRAFGVESIAALDESTAVFDATNNWWDSANGPEHAGNTFNVDFQGNAVSDLVYFVPWLDATYDIGDSFAPVENADTSEQFSSIQAAIDAPETDADNTILVAAGTYDEQVVIDKALMLQGMGDATVIQPSGPDKLTSLYTLGNQDGAYWNLQKLASIIEVSGVGTASVTVKDLKVDGVNIDSTGVPYIVGISYGETGGTIDDVTVVNMDTTGVTSSDRTYGIWLDAVTTAVSVEVKESTITLYNKNGINARGAELTVDIHDNTITGPGESPCVPNGILLINGAEGTVGPDNTITNHGYTGQWTACGIATWDVAGVIIEGNPISACGSGIGLSGNPAASQGTTDTIIRENTITGTERGVYLECPDTTNNTITGNDIQGNEYGIYLAGPESPTYDELESVGPGNVAYFNDIMGNTEYGVVNFNPEVSFEATRNYWGHASGPAHELPNDKNDKWVGKGDKVSENVDYKPWLHKSEEGVVDEKKPAYAQSVDLDNTGEYGWNTFSAPIFLDEEADTWAELVDLTDLDYNPAYRFDSDNQTFVLLTTTDNYTITPGEGFFIKMNDVGSLTILYSTAWNPTPPTRPLTAGWNLIGLANLEEMDVDVAFASIAEAPGLAGYSQVVNPIGNAESGPVFAGGTIYVGESYWVYMLGERTLAGFTMTPVKWVP